MNKRKYVPNFRYDKQKAFWKQKQTLIRTFNKLSCFTLLYHCEQQDGFDKQKIFTK